MTAIQTFDPLVEEVRAGLARRRLNQEDLAKHLGISRQAVGKRLRALVPFTHTEVAKTAELLGVPVARLYGEDV